MTARDKRLEAVAKAYFEADLGEPWETADANQRSQALRWAVGVTASYDAVRAFDEQRKEVMPHSPELRTHNATAPAASPVGADPPWLDEAAGHASRAYNGYADDWLNVVRAVLRFSAAQPPSEGEIDEAANAIADVAATIPAGQPAQNRFARAALISAARVRAGG